MSVKGDLEYQGLEDLLRANLAGEGGGRLTLRQGPHHAAMFLDEAGLCVVHPDLLDVDTVLDAFVLRGVLSREALDGERVRGLSGARLINELLATGALASEHLNDVIASEVEDTVLDLLLWEQGLYRFEREPFVAADFGLLARVSVDATGVAERALARLDDRRATGDRLGDHAILFEPVAGELPALRNENDRLHEVFARLDGEAVVHEIALQMAISRFDALVYIARLKDAGLVQMPTGDALSRAATARIQRGQHVVARALALQWSETLPDDVSPLRKLATIAQDCGDRAAEIDALCAQGSLFLRQGQSADALEIFTRAMRHAPADDVVLAGLRLAAEAAGDNDALVDGTLLTAQTKLDEGEHEAAFEMLEPLARTHPTNMAVHLLRARALMQGEKRSEFFEQAEVVGQVLDRAGCRTKADRDAIAFFRETIAHIAPERGDLLERFRAVHDPRRRRRRRFAVLGALLALVLAAGVFYWPASAPELLTRAQDAADDGNKELALEIIAELAERFPASPETEQGIRLQARLFPRAPASNRGREMLAKLRAALLARMPELETALAALPNVEAQATVRSVVESLSDRELKSVRKDLLEVIVAPATKHTTRLQEAVHERIKVLGEAASASERYLGDNAGFQTFVERAGDLRDPAWMEGVKATGALLYSLAKFSDDRALITKTQELSRSAVSLEKAAVYYDQHIPDLKRMLAGRQIETADRHCREDAPQLMVDGKIDEADAHYAELESLLTRFKDDKTYERLMATMHRRQLPQMVKDRRGRIHDIRTRLARARSLEAEGHTAQAIETYVSLMEEYWLIRFENVFTMPLRVETLPAGADVFVGDTKVGVSPTIVRYSLAGDTSLRLQAPGFATSTHALRIEQNKPMLDLRVPLVPRVVWSQEVSTDIRMPAVDVGGHALLVDRRGVLTLHDGATGEPRWTRPLRTLEGIRSQPVVAGGVIHVARVDGSVYFLAPKDGSVLGSLTLPRPRGAIAAVGERVAIATAGRTLVILRARREERREQLPAVPTTGVVAGHGAFWIGTAKGTVLRIPAAGGAVQSVQASRASAPILALAVSPQGVLATASDGTFVALAADGSTRWKRTRVGDLVGTPAECAGIASALDRAGTVHCFASKTGEPAGSLAVGGPSRHGLFAIETTLFVQRDDGQLRGFSMDTRTPLVEVTLPKNAAFSAAPIGPDHLLLPHGENQASLVPIPRRP